MSPPPAKRIRYALRSLSTNQRSNERSVESGPSKIYLTRNRAKAEHIVVKNFELEQALKRQRKRNRIPKLMMLNDDCLLSILEHTNPNTLRTMAETSGRMHELARHQFRVKYKHFDFASIIETNDELNYDMAKKLFKMFGDLMTSLNLSSWLFVNNNNNLSYNLLKMIKIHCKNLTTLKLEEIVIRNEQMAELNALFEPIETLVLKQCTFDDNNTGFRDMKSLYELKMIDFVCGWNNTLGRKFVELKRVEFENCAEMYDQYLEKFIRKNPLLQSLSVIDCEYTTTKTFATFSTLEQLQELEFKSSLHTSESYKTDVLKLAKLKQLKVLKLDCMKSSVVQLLQALIQNGVKIEHLELSNGIMNDNPQVSIEQMTTIKILKLNDMADLVDTYLVGFAKELKKLEQLYVKTDTHITAYCLKAIVENASQLSCIKIDSPGLHLGTYVYEKMLDSIRKREHNDKLDLTIYSHDEQIYIPEFEQLNGENQKWLSVKKLNRAYNHIFPKWAINDDWLDEDDWVDDEDLDDDIDDDIELPDFSEEESEYELEGPADFYSN